VNGLAASALGQFAPHVVSAAQNGSPMLMKLAGRAIGLGDADQQALAAGKVPWWAISIGALAVGFVIGVRVESSAPASVPKWLKGK